MRLPRVTFSLNSTRTGINFQTVHGPRRDEQVFSKLFRFSIAQIYGFISYHDITSPSE